MNLLILKKMSKHILSDIVKFLKWLVFPAILVALGTGYVSTGLFLVKWMSIPQRSFPEFTFMIIWTLVVPTCLVGLILYFKTVYDRARE